MATPRPRMGKHGVYNTSKYTNYKKALQIYFRSFKKYEAPKQLEIEVSFFFVTPKGYKRTKYQVPNLDVDNALKGVLDAGNNILYDDDMQVVKATVTKKYADVDCIFITIKETAVKKYSDSVTIEIEEIVGN